MVGSKGKDRDASPRPRGDIDPGVVGPPAVFAGPVTVHVRGADACGELAARRRGSVCAAEGRVRAWPYRRAYAARSPLSRSAA